MDNESSSRLSGTFSYRLYQPEMEEHYLHRDEPGGTYLFGHMASIEYFDGRFHAVWNNHHGFPYHKYLKEQGESVPFQRLLWQTSQDARSWTEPVRITEEMTATPLDQWSDPLTHWQPNLLNYLDRELWCIWSLGKGSYSDLDQDYSDVDLSEITGTYLSVLGKGRDAQWVHRRILAQVTAEAPGARNENVRGYLFPSQNPALLSSGRVVAPVTLVPGTDRDLGSLKGDAYYSAVIYSDDHGKTWEMSNLVTDTDNIAAQWEPHVMEQADGRLRMYMRDLPSSGGIHLESTDPRYRNTIRRPLFMTTTGTGLNKGEPIVFDPDPERVWIETEGSRMHRVRLPDSRYCMFHHDVWNNLNKGMRSNLALFFSRTDNNDYVAGPGITGPEPAHYPQGLVHDGKLYVAYTRWNPGIRHGEPLSEFNKRGIAVSIIDPIPDPTVRYIWPRDKDVFAAANNAWRNEINNRSFTRPFADTHDGRSCAVFRECGSAGVEIDPVDFEADEQLAVEFAFKILNAQTHGNLVLCSLGSRIPIRIGMPGNRPGMLYAYSRYSWEPVGALGMNQWNTLNISFGADTFSIRLNRSDAVSFVNPVRFPEQRLYLGEGYEVDFFESNRGSEFLIDLDSFCAGAVQNA